MLKYLCLNQSYGGDIMSKVCSVCGKGKMSGNLVSHSNRKTPRLYSPNLQKVKVTHENGSVTTELICARCLKTSKKNNA